MANKTPKSSVRNLRHFADYGVGTGPTAKGEIATQEKRERRMFPVNVHRESRKFPRNITT